MASASIGDRVRRARCPARRSIRSADAGHWPWLDQPRWSIAWRRSWSRGVSHRRRSDRRQLAGRRPAAPPTRGRSEARRPDVVAALFAIAYVIVVAAEPRPGGAPAAGQAVLRRGLRAVEQLVVRGPPRPRLQRAVPADRGRCSPRRSRPGWRRARSAALFEIAGPRPLRRGRLAGRPVVRRRRPPRTCSPAGSTFAFGLLPAIAQRARAAARRRPGTAVVLAVLTALASPVAALFAALAGGGVRDRPLHRRAPAQGGAAGDRRDRRLAGARAGCCRSRFPRVAASRSRWATLWPIPAISLVALVVADPAARGDADRAGSRCTRSGASPPSRWPLRWAATPPGWVR